MDDERANRGGRQAGAGEVQIVPAAPSHLDGIARCHVACFADQFTSRMGLRFTRDFYQCYLNRPGGVAFAALDKGGQVVGLVAGGEQGIRSEFIAKAARHYFGTILLKFLTDRVVRSALVKRLLRPRGERDAGSAWPDGQDTSLAKLQVICVRADHRGTGLAARLMLHFYEAAKQAGYRATYLSVAPDNLRAIAFYDKVGWTIIHRDIQATYMRCELG